MEYQTSMQRVPAQSPGMFWTHGPNTLSGRDQSSVKACSIRGPSEFCVQNRSARRSRSRITFFFSVSGSPPRALVRALSPLAMAGRQPPPPPPYARSSAPHEAYARPYAGEEHPSGMPAPSLLFLPRCAQQP